MKNTHYQTIKTCRVCGSKDLFHFFDLGIIPLPNEFIKKDLLKKKEQKYPLRVTYCRDCSLVQLRDVVDPEVMFKNYLYIPSSSQTRLSHFRNLAEETVERFSLSSKSLVVDIGSNDGSLLTCYKSLQIPVVGIDPAENLVKVSELNGIPTILGFIDKKSATAVLDQFGKVDLVLATNVIAHIHDLVDLMHSVAYMLKKDGVFVMQFPYLLDLIENNQFDTIYHEHLSYFCLRPLIRLSEKIDMEIFDIERNDLDGGSIRVFWKKKDSRKNQVNSEKLKKMLAHEEKSGLYAEKTYEAFAKRVEKLRQQVISELSKLRKRNKHIVGYGAAAKGNILLNYYGIDGKMLDYIVDSTSYKQGLFTPGTHIPIYEEERIYSTNPDYLLILAWNFKEEIMKKNKKYQRLGGKFIIPNPSVEIL